MAGAGAAASGCGAELLELGQRLAAPIGVSLGAYGIIPTRHGLAIGTVGDYAAPPANRIVHEADLVLFVGCHTGDQVTHAWRIPAIDTAVVQIDVDPLELGRSYPDTLGLMGDPKATLALLIQAIGSPQRDGFYAENAARIMAEWRAQRAPLLASDETPIRPDRLCAELSAALPPDAILVADTGYSGIWTSTLVDLDGAGQTYLRAAGSLGWAFPAALGAKCAAPGRKVVCFCGDGALYYHLTELETARRRGIAVVLIVNNNSGFGQGWPESSADAGQQARGPGGNAAIRADGFCRHRPRLRHPRDPRRASRRDRRGAARGDCGGRDRRRRRRDRHRGPRARAVAAGGRLNAARYCGAGANGAPDATTSNQEHFPPATVRSSSI